jgi:hypothetical protein
MAILVMLGWWYGQGWLWALGSIGRRLQHVGNVFAVKILLKTWFSPWKQISTPSTFRTFFQAMIDNTVSRFIGGIIRTFMLLAAAVWALFIIASGLVLIVLWPFLPAAVLALPLLTIGGVTL